MKKRMLAAVLALVLILNLVPAAALAAGGSSDDGTPPELTYGAWEVGEDGIWTWIWPDDEDPYKDNSDVSNPYLKSYGQSGFCTFDPNTGTLTIQSSTHIQYDPGYAERPWESFQDEIKSIVADGSEVEGGITIGTRAFSGLTSLESVELTNCTLKESAFEDTVIGTAEFTNCTLDDLHALSKNLFNNAKITNLKLDSCTLAASSNSLIFGSGTIENLELTKCNISGTSLTFMFQNTSVTNIVTNGTDLPTGTFTNASGVETITVNGGSLGATYASGSYATAFPKGTMQSVTVDGATLSQGALSCPATTITIKNTDLPAYTIYNDYAVQALTLEDIGSIASYSFCTVPNLKTVTLDTVTGSLGAYWIYKDCTSLESVSVKNVGTLPQYCFWDLPALKEVYLENIGTVSAKAFYYDSQVAECSLETISYKNVDTFSPSAFQSTIIKATVTIEEVQEIPGLDNPLAEPVVWKNGKWDEDTTNNIWTYYIDDLTWQWDSTENKWTYTKEDEPKSACTYDPETQTLTLLTSTPDYSETGGQPWTSGGPFDGENSANKIENIVAENITVGAYAFAAIEDLESVTLKGVTLKEYSVAYTSAKKITIENVDTLPSYSIASNHQLETLTVENVEEIALGAIWYNGSTTDDSLPLTLTISDVDTLPSGAIYKNHNLTTLKLENITTLEKYFISDGYEGEPGDLSYYGSQSLEAVELKNVKKINAYAFYNCPKLSSLSGLKDAQYIGGYAFYNCPNLEWDYVNDQPSDTAQIGWNQFFQQSEAMIARMKAIMADKFSLAKAQTPEADKLTVSGGWDDSKTGAENSTAVNGNQVTKSAQWTDSDRTKAQVQFQFTSAEEPGADFLFVVDSSASMSIVGNRSDTSGNTGSGGPELPSDDDVRETGEDLEPAEDELNARFYAMQSKLLDVTDELLTAQGYNNRVAVLSFGGYYNGSETVESTGNFISDADTMRNYLLNDFEPYYENTDFVMALNTAYERFVEDHDTSRKLVVIFISDGIPTVEYDGTTAYPIGVNAEQPWVSTYRPNIADAAQKITDAGAEIFGVLHLYAGEPDDQVARANSAMSAVCGRYFEADDTEEFSEAVNNAIGAGWGVYTLTDTVAPGFTLDQDSITVTCGETQVTADDDGNKVITWIIYGVPFTAYTMNYDVTLNQVDGVYPYGHFDTNEGDAVVTKGIGTEQAVNGVETPQLSRGLYTVTYTDGIENAEVFPDQVTSGLPYGTATPDFAGTPARPGYEFTGWSPVVADTVTDNVTYVAQWEKGDDPPVQPDDLYTVTYTDGVENAEVFPDQVYLDLPYGTATPDFAGTPARRGYEFTGWSPAVADTVTGDVAYVAQWKKVYNPPVHPVQPGKPQTKPESEPEPEPPALNTEDHVAYIIGYVDGTVRPLSDIRRSEVATIFFRLLTDESRAYYWSQTNPYSDVDSDDWFNNAVSTLSNAGIITGYTDGTFRPNAPITRSEFAAIAARFSDVVYTGGNSFSDVPASHWAARYIALAEHLGWITGYPDGTFKPEQNITRAESMTLINRVLKRAVDEDGLLPNMVVWSDNLPGTWYYEAVQEATNSHEYVQTLNIVPGQDFYYENWREIEKVPDWAALEKNWSTAYSK